MSQGTIQYTHDNFLGDLSEIIKDYHNQKPNIHLIVGVNRGGCLAAVCLSHALDIPCTMIDYATRDGANITPESLPEFFERISEKYRHILIVDDIIDGGTTMNALWKMASPFVQVSFATLLYNSDLDLQDHPDIYWGTQFSRTSEPRYYDFWWEVIK